MASSIEVTISLVILVTIFRYVIVPGLSAAAVKAKKGPFVLTAGD